MDHLDTGGHGTADGGAGGHGRGHGLGRARTPLLLLGCAAGAFALGGALAANGPNDRGRCVGMFMAARGDGLPQQVAADSKALTVRGTVPCLDAVFAWAPQGPCRVFEDGTVEILVAPMPPCPGGDHYAWIAFPR